jgi:anaerobic selenocysteine-containing dehydrogenase
MQACLPQRLFTPDKTIRLAPDEFVSDLKDLSTDLAADGGHSEPSGYDLRLIGRRDPRTNNSWLHNSYRMVKGKQRCLALIHPDDAAPRKLENGNVARVSSRVGSIRIPIAISEDMMPGVISIPLGWGHQMEGVKLGVAKQHAGVNTNILTDDQFLDSVSGNAVLNGVPVSVCKD